MTTPTNIAINDALHHRNLRQQLGHPALHALSQEQQQQQHYSSMHQRQQQHQQTGYSQQLAAADAAS